MAKSRHDDHPRATGQQASQRRILTPPWSQFPMHPRAAVAKAALAMIRDEIKNQRDKLKAMAAAAKAKAKASKPVVAKRAPKKAVAAKAKPPPSSAAHANPQLRPPANKTAPLR